MNCSDPVCIKLMTCKWDMPVSKTWCEAMYYPEPEIKIPQVKHVQEEIASQVQPEERVEFKRKPFIPRTRRTEFLGRSYRGD